MDKIETLLAKARFQKSELEKKLALTSNEIENTEVPLSGSISVMVGFRERLDILRKEKARFDEMLSIKINEVNQLQDKYKRAHMEYEKIKYLENQDFEEWIEKIKRQEQLDMDEISNMLFVNKGEMT
jgi:predicted nuclease with TOPRIM domain